MAYPPGMYAFIEKCSGTALVFTLKKFTHDPFTIALVTSINVLFGILLAPAVSYLSDSIGCRRKPFMLPGLCLLAISLLILPNTNTLAMTIVVVIFYQLSVDIGFNSLWQPLYADIVPDNKRQYGMIINRYFSIGARLFFMYFLIGQFDRGMKGKGGGKQVFLAGKSFIANLTGEQLIYYIAALLAIGTVILLVFIKEVPKPVKKDNKFSFRNIFRSLFENKNYRNIYLLILASSLMRVRLGCIWPLMVTEQFHLSKQSLGNIHSLTMIITLSITLPLAAILVNRINRWRLFMICIVVSTLHPLAFWIYVNYISPTPKVFEIVCFQVMNAAAEHIGFITLWPLIFEFVPSRKRGTVNAGLLFITGITTFVMGNIVAMVVKAAGTGGGNDMQGYNYSIGMLVIFIAGVAGCIITLKAKLK